MSALFYFVVGCLLLSGNCQGKGRADRTSDLNLDWIMCIEFDVRRCVAPATWGSNRMSKKPAGRKRPNVWESVDLRQEQHEAKRRLILKQAAVLFADRGFH